MTNDLQTARELRDAAGYLREHGWIQFQKHHPDGRSRMGGALLVAAGLDDIPAPATIEQGQHWIRLVTALGFRIVIKLRGPDTDDLPLWNDTPGRTLDEVLDRLESTALALEVRALAADKPAESPRLEEEACVI